MISGNYVKSDGGKMIHITDVQKLAELFTQPDYGRWASFRLKLMEMHGREYYQEAQSVVFYALFSSMPVYTKLLEMKIYE